MKSRIAKPISFLMTILIIVTIIPLSVSAAYENTHTNTGNQARDIVAIAQTQIGYQEGSNNNNKYGAAFNNNYAPWCAYFISWCAKEAGISDSIIHRQGVASPFAGYFNIPNTHSKGDYFPKPGDLVFYGPNSNGDHYHVGLVETVDKSTGKITTIEGNTNSGGSSEGYIVYRHTRHYQYSSICCYGTPNYSGNDVHTCSFSGSYFEAAHPHRVYQQCSCGKTQYTGETKAYSSCSSCMKLSWAYAIPFKAYTINTGKTTVYSSVGGSAISNKIYDTDLCTISEVYDCGWCKVTFPLDAGGNQTGYVKVSAFVKGGGYIVTASKQLTTYSRSDLKTSIGNTGSGDKIYILGNTSSAVQISYPLSAGGYKVGWVPISSLSATIKYNANGGSGTMSNTSAKYQSTFTLSTNKFTKTGYTFSGWNVYRSSDKKWYTTNGNGWQTASSITSKGYTKQTYKNGWSGKLDQSWLNLGKTSETFTFYPIWKANTLSVYYNANGGSIKSDTYKISSNLIYKVSDGEKYAQSWTYNKSKTDGLINASTFGLSKTGHTFSGWGTSSNGGTIFDSTDSNIVPTDINSNIKTKSCSKTLYAIWTPKTYKITFDANGGTGAPASQTKTYGKVLTLSSTNPQRSGYRFLGWSTSSTATTAEYLAGGSFTVNKATTLYAVWEKEHVHTYFDEITTPSTCTVPGVMTYTCACGDKYTKTIPAKGHTEVVDKAIFPNCTETGLTEGKHCSECNTVLIKQNEVGATGHSAEEDWTTISTSDAGKITQVKYCSRCGEVVETREVVDSNINSEPTESTTESTSIATEPTETTVTEPTETTSSEPTETVATDPVETTYSEPAETTAATETSDTEPIESQPIESTAAEPTESEVEDTATSTASDDETEPTEPSTPDETEPTETTTPDEAEPSEPVEDKGVLGDVNGDGKVNVKDATLIQKYSAKIEKLSDAEFIHADVNKDAKVNIKDATAIQKYVAKIETGLPIGKPVE